jgi:hypothetical protein
MLAHAVTSTAKMPVGGPPGKEFFAAPYGAGAAQLLARHGDQ